MLNQGSIVDIGSPTRRKLQKPNHEITGNWTEICVSFIEKKGRLHDICDIWVRSVFMSCSYYRAYLITYAVIIHLDRI